jgi:hypothetical protein
VYIHKIKELDGKKWTEIVEEVENLEGENGERKQK